MITIFRLLRNRYLLTGLILGGFLAGYFIFSNRTQFKNLQTENDRGIEIKKVEVDANIGSQITLSDLGRQIQQELGEGMFEKKNEEVLMGITSHHIPTALPLIAGFYKELSAASGPRDVFLIVGPDHQESCKGNITAGEINYQTPFGVVETDESLLKELVSVGASSETECFLDEHAIAAQTSFIKYIYPDAKIVSVFISAKITNQELKIFQNFIETNWGKMFVLGSLDFSHYENLDKAQELDYQTRSKIVNLDMSGINVSSVDSPGTLRMLIDLARKQKLKPFVQQMANSFEFTKDPVNTTGYMNVVFRKE